MQSRYEKELEAAKVRMKAYVKEREAAKAAARAEEKASRANEPVQLTLW
jgi:hypothetical protein